MKIKKMLCIVATLVIVMSFNTQILFATSDVEVSIKINDLAVIMHDESQDIQLSALIREGRTMAPIRPIFDKFDLDLNWNGDENSITTTTPGGKTVWMQIDNNVARVDGEEYIMDIGPTIINSRTYVPVRYIFDLLDVEYSWDGESRQVEVSAPELLEVEIDDSLEAEYEDAISVSEKSYLIRNKLDNSKIILVNISDMDYDDEIINSATKMGILSSEFTTVNSINFKYNYFYVEDIFAGVVLEKDDKVYSMEFKGFSYEEVINFLKKY